jgi:hypothetical protein
MGRIVSIFLLILIVVVGTGISAQEKGKGKAANDYERVHMPNVYLGRSEKRGGPMQKGAFTDLMKQGLTAHDSLGNHYKVVGFDFSYAEQKLYEDSLGNMVMMTDLSAEYCPGDTLAADIAYNIHMLKSAYLTDSADLPKGLYERVKPGDTLYFDHVRVRKLGKNSTLSVSDTATIAGRGMKFYIVK